MIEFKEGQRVVHINPSHDNYEVEGTINRQWPRDTARIVVDWDNGSGRDLPLKTEIKLI